jgi:hypothetical protein
MRSVRRRKNRHQNDFDAEVGREINETGRKRKGLGVAAIDLGREQPNIPAAARLIANRFFS